MEFSAAAPLKIRLDWIWSLQKLDILSQYTCKNMFLWDFNAYMFLLFPVCIIFVKFCYKNQCQMKWDSFPRIELSLFSLFCCLLLFAVAVASVAARRSQRAKRGLLELAGAIKCSTGRSALAYMMYGCYCGLGGQGWPRDQADWWGGSLKSHTSRTRTEKKTHLTSQNTQW